MLCRLPLGARTMRETSVHSAPTAIAVRARSLKAIAAQASNLVAEEIGMTERFVVVSAGSINAIATAKPPSFNRLSAMLHQNRRVSSSPPVSVVDSDETRIDNSTPGRAKILKRIAMMG